jgi:hypothetical protein
MQHLELQRDAKRQQTKKEAGILQLQRDMGREHLIGVAGREGWDLANMTLRESAQKRGNLTLSPMTGGLHRTVSVKEHMQHYRVQEDMERARRARRNFIQGSPLHQGKEIRKMQIEKVKKHERESMLEKVEARRKAIETKEHARREREEGRALRT